MELGCGFVAHSRAGRREMGHRWWQKGRALPLTSLLAAPLHQTQHRMKPFLPLCYLFVWCTGWSCLGTEWSSFGVHRSSKVMLSLRRRNLLSRSIVDQKGNKIYIWKRPQVRSECAIGHIWACVRAKSSRRFSPSVYTLAVLKPSILKSLGDCHRHFCWKVFWGWEEGFEAAF